MSVGALLAADMVSIGVSGLAQSAAVMGSALLAVPAARIVRLAGRRPSLAALYLTAALGAAIVVSAAMTRSIPLLFVGYFLFGAGTAAGLQARFAAVDLAPAEQVGRHLAFVVWATTIGGVVGPNLAPVAVRSFGGYGVPALATPFVISAMLYVLIAAFLFTALRPDPAVVARERAARGGVSARRADGRHFGIGDAFRAVRASADATLGIAATAVGHVVMVAVMSMTPVHIAGAGHAAHDTIRIVGIVISVHIAGMYAFAPVMGWLSDRFGRRAVIHVGIVLLLAACAIAGTAGHDAIWLAVGLFVLGLGWSATMVAGSALLSASIGAEVRPAAQGLSDLVMGVAGASAGALAGIAVGAFGFPALTLAAAVTALLVAGAARGRR
jgi:MFS family permease